MVTSARASLAPSERAAAPPPRTIERRRDLPGSRAVLGGLLVVAAAVGVYLAYTDAAAGPSSEVVVAAAPLRMGEVIEAGDLRTVAADLPADARAGAFSSPEELVGGVVIGPIGDGELIQASAVTREASAGALHEVALTLPRAQVAVGRLRAGERVDVFSTSEDTTRSVVRGAEVVDLREEDRGALGAAGDVTLIVSVDDPEQVAALVHALRTSDVTVVRSTLAGPSEEPVVFAPAAGDEAQDRDASDEDDRDR